jgi:hypothetical protein
MYLIFIWSLTHFLYLNNIHIYIAFIAISHSSDIMYHPCSYSEKKQTLKNYSLGMAQKLQPGNGSDVNFWGSTRMPPDPLNNLLLALSLSPLSTLPPEIGFKFKKFTVAQRSLNRDYSVISQY